MLRSKIVDIDKKRLLIANLNRSDSPTDNFSNVNCNGLGRVRKFTNYTLHGVPHQGQEKKRYRRILSIGYKNNGPCRTQVFHLLGCSWRCWYCYVENKLLSGESKYGQWMTCDELLQLYFEQRDPPDIIDLSGGQPDLVPEWAVWMIEAIKKNGVGNKIHIRSENNLSNFLLRDKLNKSQIRLLLEYEKYTMVGCFKGFDEDSFSFNTKANKEFFDIQFEVAKYIIDLGIEFLAYVTLTGIEYRNISDKMNCFFDKLQAIHQDLPLRIVPLTIAPFPSWNNKIKPNQNLWTEVQRKAQHSWFEVLEQRFSANMRKKNFEQIILK